MGVFVACDCSWMFKLESVTGALVSGIRKLGWRCNNDGIDIVSSQDVTVENCFIRSADDAIAVKGMDAAMDTRNVVVRDSILFPHGNCMETGFELFNTNVRCPGMSGLSLCIKSNSIVGGHSLMCHAVRWLARWPT